MEDNFKTGDIVRLKSGGPNMTVEKYGNYHDGRKCLCKWFDDKNKLDQKLFMDAELEIVHR
jgi:uncharacterized protein YodC (DUF2158 family)